jgi:cyclic pyranopterin monophosphate synthase
MARAPSNKTPPSPKLSHLDRDGRASMVDVSAKPSTLRSATARGLVSCAPSTRDALLAGTGHKGEAVATARIAGVMAAKRTGELIPLCHPLALSDVQIAIDSHPSGLVITATTCCVGPTGVEMEAMTAVTVAALTLYDMAKAVDRGMRIEAVELVEKTGGRSGVWRRS